MSSYHCSVKSHSRSPKSALTGPAAAAYRSGTRIKCERDGRVHDYTPRAPGVEAQFIVAPDGVAWAQDREFLWNRVETAEKRKDALFAHEIEIAIPYEIDRPADRRELVRRFVCEVVKRQGVVADVAIHKPHRHGDARNWHAHVLLTTRRADATGFAAIKDRTGLNHRDTSGAEIEALRELWADLENDFLERAGSDARVDHRSFERRGEALMPMRHLGKEASVLERKEGTKEREAAREAGVAPPMPTGPGASLPPSGVAKAGSMPVTEAGRYNAAAQAENASTFRAKAAREAEIAAMQAEVARLAAELRVEEAREARVEQIASAARLDQARARLGIAKRGQALPPHLRTYGLDTAAALGINLSGASAVDEPTAEIAPVPPSRPGAATRRRSANSRSTRPRVARSHEVDAAQTAAITARDAERAAALEASIAAIRSAWGKSPTTADGTHAVLHWREVAGDLRLRSGADQAQRLARAVGAPDMLVSQLRNHHTAQASFAALGAYRASLLSVAGRASFDQDLTRAARYSAETYLAEWAHEQFKGRRAATLPLSDRLLEAAMARHLGLPRRSDTEIIDDTPVAPTTKTASNAETAHAATRATARSAAAPAPSSREKSTTRPSATPTPAEAARPSATPEAAIPTQAKKPADRVQTGRGATVGSREGSASTGSSTPNPTTTIPDPSPPPPPPQVDKSAAGLGHNKPPPDPAQAAKPKEMPRRKASRADTHPNVYVRTPGPDDVPIGAAAADALLRDAGIVHVNSAGVAEVVVTYATRRGRQSDASAWDPEQAIWPLYPGAGSTTFERIAGSIWATMRQYLTDTANTIGAKSWDLATRWIGDLVRANTEGTASKSRAKAEAEESDKAAQRAWEDHKATMAAAAAARAQDPDTGPGPRPSGKKPKRRPGRGRGGKGGGPGF